MMKGRGKCKKRGAEARDSVQGEGERGRKKMPLCKDVHGKKKCIAGGWTGRSRRKCQNGWCE